MDRPVEARAEAGAGEAALATVAAAEVAALSAAAAAAAADQRCYGRSTRTMVGGAYLASFAVLPRPPRPRASRSRLEPAASEQRLQRRSNQTRLSRPTHLPPVSSRPLHPRASRTPFRRKRAESEESHRLLWPRHHPEARSSLRYSRTAQRRLPVAGIITRPSQGQPAAQQRAAQQRAAQQRAAQQRAAQQPAQSNTRLRR